MSVHVCCTHTLVSFVIFAHPICRLVDCSQFNVAVFKCTLKCNSIEAIFIFRSLSFSSLSLSHSPRMGILRLIWFYFAGIMQCIDDE